MAHQSQLENRKYRNWVKAGLGLKYTKEGLEPFCDKLVKQLHVDILYKVKQKHNLTAVACGNCDIKTIQPDHVSTRYRQCPLGQTNCNCQHPRGKTSCSVCGAIYDEIIRLHASTPPSPYWKNTDAKHWCTEPWSVAKCFINVDGYKRKLKASEFDCSGLLHLLLNNTDFRDHLNCTTDGTNLLQTVLQHRNTIYHSHDIELEDEDVTTYLDDMIALLQDDKELINTKPSKAALVKLEELKREDFIITTTSETELRRAVMADVDHITKVAEQQKHELETITIKVSDHIIKTGNKRETDLIQQGLVLIESIEDTATKVKIDLPETMNQYKDDIVSLGTKLKANLEKDCQAETSKGKLQLEQKRKEIETEIKTKLDILLEQKVKLYSVIETGQSQRDQNYHHKQTNIDGNATSTASETVSASNTNTAKSTASIPSRTESNVEIDGNAASTASETVSAGNTNTSQATTLVQSRTESNVVQSRTESNVGGFVTNVQGSSPVEQQPIINNFSYIFNNSKITINHNAGPKRSSKLRATKSAIRR